MSERSAGIAGEPAVQGDFSLSARIDVLQSGDCTEAEFMREVLPLRDSVWATIALVDQRYRRGLLPEETFRSIKSKLARHALEQGEYGRTVELNPSMGVTPAAKIHPTQFRFAAAQTDSVDRIRYVTDRKNLTAPGAQDGPSIP